MMIRTRMYARIFRKGQKRNTERGVTLIVALAMMMILLGAGLTYAFVIRAESFIAENHLNALKAIVCADAGVEYAFGEIRNGSMTYPWQGDINGDTTNDFNVSYNPTTKVLTSTTLSPYTPRTVTAQINTSGFTSAIIAGDDIKDMGQEVMGNVRGNIDTSALLASLADLQVDGTITVHPSVISPSIPTPNLPAYLSIAAQTPAAPFTLSSNPGLGGGILYVDGDIIINAPDLVVDGTLVATGDITVNSNATGLTIQPTGDYPALIAGGKIVITGPGFGSTNMSFFADGLVYAGDIQVSEANGIVVNGALVALVDIKFSRVQGISITYDPGLDPPDFSGGTSGTEVIVHWKAH